MKTDDSTKTQYRGTNQRVMALFVLVACSASGVAADSNAAVATKPTALVDADWLADHLEQPNVRLIELGQTREQHAAGHLPGAVFVDWVHEITDPEKPERYTKVSKLRMGQLLGELGVTNNTTVVLSDTTDNRLAVRMFWMLRYYGHQNVCVLDGGRKAWLRSGRSLTTGVTKPAPTVYVVLAEQEQLCADRRFVEKQLGNNQVVLIDGRPAQQFTGEMPGKVYHTGTEHARRGHIPGAINIPWKANLKADGTFKSPDDLRKLYAKHGVDAPKLAITYCNEGLHAAMPWFVLTELLGHEKATLYDDSMAEWANTSDAPVAVSKRL